MTARGNRQDQRKQFIGLEKVDNASLRFDRPVEGRPSELAVQHVVDGASELIRYIHDKSRIVEFNQLARDECAGFTEDSRIHGVQEPLVQGCVATKF